MANSHTLETNVISQSDRARLRQRALVLSLALWAFMMGLLYYAGTFTSGGPIPPFELWLIRLVWMASGFALGWLIYRILEWSMERSSVGPIVSLVVLVCVFGALHTIANSLLYFELAGLSATPFQMFGLVTYWLHFQLAWGVLILTLVMGAQASAERQARLQAQREAQVAQLDALTFQVHPHFLFNTLGAVSSLVGENQFEKGEEMVRKLAVFLRRSFRREANDDVTLEQEFEDLRVYVRIERIRFEKRFDLKFSLSDCASDALVPGLLLQPLVENAIKYAVAPSADFVSLELAAKRIGDDVEITLTDDGPGAPQTHGLGTGEANVRNRLVARFGGRVLFSSGARPERGYLVRMRFPYQASIKSEQDQARSE
ncbi:sensor histidine kinase [Erythrobacter sp. NAP1]|uniref:sensor histidine kinase n=1 Tax=Erythrobacter sp. NAP1 TaxID=237727 RepID=UPI000068521E|nr:histidine kinase [Erythrobacter sp. NAP1]EAQ27879.1 sensor histidine kinase [Erythrobacter sp. NAP1]